MICSLSEHIKIVTSLRAEISLYQKNNSELKQLNQILKDEHQALQLAFTKLEEKLRKSQVIFIITIIFNCNRIIRILPNTVLYSTLRFNAYRKCCPFQNCFKF